jgi:sugar (pentulose or hexulose) kinase
LLAGAGSGRYQDAGAAAAASVVLTRRYDPDPAQALRYADRFALYEQLYPTVRGIQRQL